MLLALSKTNPTNTLFTKLQQAVKALANKRTYLPTSEKHNLGFNYLDGFGWCSFGKASGGWSFTPYN